jgi:hypothetical protein
MLIAYCGACKSFEDPFGLIPVGTKVIYLDPRESGIARKASISDGNGDLLPNAQFVRFEPDGCKRTPACGEVALFDVRRR